MIMSDTGWRLKVVDNVLDYGRIVHSENYGLLFYVMIIDFDFINTSADFKA